MKQRVFKTVISIFLLFVISPGLSAQTGVIKGRIFNDLNNEPIPFANIAVTGTSTGAVSDADGKFEIPSVKPGFIRLTATSVGFEAFITAELQVINAHSIYIDVPMKKKSVELNEVEIKASAFRKNIESPLSLRRLSIAEIEKNPGSNRDISKVLLNLPGVASAVSYRNDLIVRGGGPAENRFYLDGVEIPNLNHFATQGASGGPVGIINTDFIREANLYTGAFPANRGNSLSSILDIRMKDGNTDKPVFRATLGASEAALSSDGPLGKKTTYLFSLRRSYLQLLFKALKLPFLPTYNDYQFKIKTKMNQNNELTIIGNGAYDVNKLNTGISNPDEQQKFVLDYLPVNNQWSYVMGAVYRHYSKKLLNTWVLSRNMLNNEQIKYEGNRDNDPSALSLHYNSREQENKLRYENEFRSGQFKIVSGAGIESVKYSNTTYQKVFVVTPTDTLREINYRSNLSFGRYYAFAQAGKEFMQEKLSVSFGVRADGNNYSSGMSNPLTQLSPRLSASFGLTEKLFLNFNTGRYYQLPSYTTLGLRSSEGTLINKENKVQYIRADHLVFGVEYRPVTESRLTLEVFYKHYSNYPVSLRDSISLAAKGADYGVVGDEPVISDGKGRAYGAELYYRGKLADNTDLLVSYTYVVSRFTNLKGDYIASSWDNGNILNILLSHQFTKNWQAGLKWRYAGGLPYTPYNLDKSSLVDAWDAKKQGYYDFSRFNGNRLKSFHQLDIRVDKEWLFKRWSLTLYFDIQNAYNYKADQPPYLTLDYGTNGAPVIYTDASGIQRYKLKEIASNAGTVLPSVGIIVDL
jgi:hypothetical protein